MATFPQTLGELKKSGYQSKASRGIRANLIANLKERNHLEGIHGYDTTVIPQWKGQFYQSIISTYLVCVVKQKLVD